LLTPKQEKGGGGGKKSPLPFYRGRGGEVTRGRGKGELRSYPLFLRRKRGGERFGSNYVNNHDEEERGRERRKGKKRRSY